MKLHSILSDLLFFLLILCTSLWSIIVSFTNTNQIFNEWNFPFTQLLLALFSAFIFIYYWKNESKNERTPVFILLKKVFPAIITLCILFCSALILKAVTCFINKSGFSGNQEAVLPSGFKEAVYCLLSFIFAAFYEEVIYRFYLPEIFKSFVFKRFENSKVIKIFSELLVLFLFSLAHVYLGWMAVINAVIAHIVLRLCFIKSECIWSGFAAHFIYNMLVLFLI